MDSTSQKHDLLSCERASGRKRLKMDISESEGEEDTTNELFRINLGMQSLLEEEDSNDFQPPTKVDLPWEFVESVIDRHKKISSSPKGIAGIEPIASDDLYNITAKMFQCQNEFLETGTPVEVTLAYHYTHERHITSIRQGGLVSGNRGGTFGRGIYLGNNASAFHSRGPIGLIVAILKGRCKYVERSKWRNTRDFSNQNANTLIGNKKANCGDLYCCPNYHDEIVLQEARQCVPIIKFDGSLVDKSGNGDEKGNDSLWIYHREIQRVVDLYFNSGVSLSTKITKSDIFPNTDKKYSTLQSIPHRRENIPTFSSNNESQIGQQWSSYHNLPQHYFDEETRDDAVANLLLHRSMSVASALEYAGFVDSEVKDRILHRNIVNLLAKLKKWAKSQFSDLPEEDALVRTAAKNLLNYSCAGTGIIRDVMSSAGFREYEIHNTEKRHQVLVEFIKLQTISFDIHDSVMEDPYLSLSFSSNSSHKITGDHQGQHCHQETRDDMLKSVVKTDSPKDLLVGPNITVPKRQAPYQLHISTFQSLNSRLDHVAKYLAIYDVFSDRTTIDNLLTQSGFALAESENSRYQIYVMIKANMFRRVLYRERESIEVGTQYDQEDAILFQRAEAVVTTAAISSATTASDLLSQNVITAQSMGPWSTNTLI